LVRFFFGNIDRGIVSNGRNICIGISGRKGRDDRL
jgi:hypothetical protein